MTKAVADKVVRRHPHVFGEEKNDKSFGRAQWKEQKRKEGGGDKSILDDAVSGTKTMYYAVTLGLRAARVGFDWPDTESEWAKVAWKGGNREHWAAETSAERREELGDLLFCLASLAHQMRINPDSALEEVREKFRRRIRAVEQGLEEKGSSPSEATLEEMECLWRRAAAADKAAA